MDVRCDVCFQRVALTGKKSKRGPDKVSHHYRPGMGVCAGSYATPTDAMRAEGEAHAKEERERWERLRREQEERAAEEDRAKYFEAISVASSFSSMIVNQSIGMLEEIGIEAASSVLAPLIRSSVEVALSQGHKPIDPTELLES